MYEKFSKLLQEKHLSTYRVSKDTGISQQTFSDWKIGKSKPKLDKLQKIADYFGVSVEYFTTDKEEQKNIPPKTERDIVMDFVNDLSDSDFDRLSSVIKAIFPEKFKD